MTTTMLRVNEAVWKPTGGTHTQSKVYRDGHGHVLKHMRGGNPDKVRREFLFLEALAPNAYFAAPIECGPDYIVMGDLGEHEPVTELRTAMSHGLTILKDLDLAGIRHNDLRSLANIIVVGNVPHVVDFGQAQWLDEEPMPRVYPDEAMLVTLVQLYAVPASGT